MTPELFFLLFIGGGLMKTMYLLLKIASISVFFGFFFACGAIIAIDLRDSIKAWMSK